MAMDVVYVLGKGSRWNNHEIRFSLRSVEKYLRNVRKVWIVGEHHPLLQEVDFIPYPDKTTDAAANIMYKITRACDEAGISDTFLFMNDDYYLLTEFDAETFPYYYSGTLRDFLKVRGMDGYTKKVGRTLEYLESKGLPIKHFDTHYPILYNKLVFVETVTKALDWHGAPGVIKSIYANSLKIEGISEPDHKSDKPPRPGAKVFSSGSQVKASVQRFLLEQFPEKCRYEVRDF